MKKDTRTPITLRFDPVLLARMDTHADAIRRTRTEVLHRAVEEYLDKHAPQPAKPAKADKSQK